MKNIRLGAVTPMGSVTTAAQFFIDLLDNSPDATPDGRAAGITPASMRRRFKLIDLFTEKKDEESVQIEDSDFDYLNKLFAASAYGKSARAVIEVEDRLLEAAK